MSYYNAINIYVNLYGNILFYILLNILLLILQYIHDIYTIYAQIYKEY